MIYAILYVLCTGFSTILMEEAGLSFSLALILVFGSLMAFLYFNLINFRYLRQMYQACLQHKKIALLINVYIFVVWLACVYGTVYAGASLFTFLFFASLGASSRLVEFLQHRKWLELLSFILILLLLVAAIYINIDQKLNIHIVKGVICGVVGGVAGYLYLKLSGSFMKECGLKATQVLAMRFYLAFVLGCFFLPKGAIADLTVHNTILIFLIVCLNFMVPLYFSQRAVQSIGSEITSSIISCLPLVAGVMEFFLITKVPNHNFVIYALYVVIVGLPYIHVHRKKKRAA